MVFTIRNLFINVPFNHHMTECHLDQSVSSCETHNSSHDYVPKYSTSCIFSLKHILPEDGIAETFCSRILLEGRHQHRFLQARQELLQLSDNGKPVKRFSTILIPIHRKEHLWLDLFEAINHATGAEIG